MAKVYTTEITSEQIASDNPIHQRLFKAYVIAKDYVQGNVLEVGCGEGRGVDLLVKQAARFTAVDKIKEIIDRLQQKYPEGKFISMNIPPLDGLLDNVYDSIVSFQVIEHIQNDFLYLKEIHRVLKPGGIALITTPNRKKSLSRNPWHIREYLPDELKTLAQKVFAQVEMKGITGNERIMRYYEQNKKSVERVTRWDILNLQYRLPAALLRLPYEILNRRNRNKLQSGDNKLVNDIHHSDYIVVDNANGCLGFIDDCAEVGIKFRLPIHEDLSYLQKKNIISTPKRHINESDLITGLKAKDKSALAYLYDNYSGALYGVIYRVIKKEAIAEEVLQDVFMKIWERFDSYDATKGKLFTWMVNVARNQAIDKTRSKEINKDKKTGGIDNVVSRIDNKEYIEQNIEGIGVKDILKSLPDDQKFIVERLYFQGYSQSELSEEFNIPLGTVKTRVRMAMQQLRSTLGITVN